MSGRRLALLAAAAGLAAPFALGACSEACPTESPKLGSVPACPPMAAGATVSVTLGICPACNHTSPSCAALPPVDGVIQLEPAVEACDPGTGCPIPSCPVAPPTVTCVFQAPAAGSYQLLVVDPSTGQPVQRAFTVAAAGGATTCG